MTVRSLYPRTTVGLELRGRHAYLADNIGLTLKYCLRCYVSQWFLLCLTAHSPVLKWALLIGLLVLLRVCFEMLSARLSATRVLPWFWLLLQALLRTTALLSFLICCWLDQRDFITGDTWALATQQIDPHNPVLGHSNQLDWFSFSSICILYLLWLNYNHWLLLTMTTGWKNAL
jgi:hypothetical protein